MEMIALCRVMAILHFKICMPMRWLAGNTHSVDAVGYNWSSRSLGKIIDAIHDVMDIDDVFKPGHDSITFNTMLSNILKFEFTQSWAFKMFPGIHYNFTCRVVKKHPGRNEDIESASIKDIL